MDPVDVSNAVLFLASDESRYITGIAQVTNMGALAPFKIRTSDRADECREGGRASPAVLRAMAVAHPARPAAALSASRR
jgi:hypothetical protein